MTKIIYDSSNKNNVINNLNSCIDEVNVINDIFYNLDVPYEFKYKSNINDIRRNFKYIEEALYLYKNGINGYMEELNKNELEISALINKIEDNIVGKFE